MRVPKKYEGFLAASYSSYASLSEESRRRTSRAAWIALKLGVSEKVAQGYIDEYESRGAEMRGASEAQS